MLAMRLDNIYMGKSFQRKQDIGDRREKNAGKEAPCETANNIKYHKADSKYLPTRTHGGLFTQQTRIHMKQPIICQCC